MAGIDHDARHGDRYERQTVAYAGPAAGLSGRNRSGRFFGGRNIAAGCSGRSGPISRQIPITAIAPDGAVRAQRFLGFHCARVGHVFEHREDRIGGVFLRSISITRAKARIGLMNLVYNLSRLEVLVRLRRVSFDRVVVPA